MRCTPNLGEEDREMSGQWLMKVEESFFEILVPEDMQVNYMARLLFDEAQTWWAIVKEIRIGEVLTWAYFKHEFEIRYYSEKY
jgi:hypothetical protein